MHTTFLGGTTIAAFSHIAAVINMISCSKGTKKNVNVEK